MMDLPGTPKLRYVLLCLGLIVLIPVAAFPLPPLIDLPNHTARLWLITGGLHDPALAQFYAEDWSHIGTNIGIDLAAKLLGPVIPAFTLARLLLALAVILPPFGAIALNAAQFRKLEPWQLVFPYFWATETLLAGFLNFEIGLGLALFAAAADRRWEASRFRHVIRFALAELLFIIHPYALLFYCGLLAALAFGAAAPKRPAILPRMKRAAAAAVICLMPLALFFAWTQALPGGHHWAVLFNGAAGTLGALASPFVSYNALVDILFAYPIIVLVGYAAVNRKIELHAGLALLAAVFAIAALFMPTATNEGTWLDRRLPIMAVLTALAACRVSLAPSRRQVMAWAAVALVTLRTAWIGWNWSAGAALLQSTRSVLALVPPGAAILPVAHKPHDLLLPAAGRILGANNETYGHFAALAVPWQHAFVPTLFSERGKQPIRVLAPWSAMAQANGGPELPSVHALRDPRLGWRYMQDWQRRFDYILVLNADQPDRWGPFVPLPAMRLVKDDGFAQLYRIEHGS